MNITFLKTVAFHENYLRIAVTVNVICPRKLFRIFPFQERISLHKNELSGPPKSLPSKASATKYLSLDSPDDKTYSMLYSK